MAGFPGEAAAAGGPGAFPGLAATLRARTAALHATAERSGIVRDLILGRADRGGYALLLRNLLPAYAALERGLERWAGHPAALPALARVPALEADLAALLGPGWREAADLLPAGARYARRVARAAERGGGALLGHAYVRYLGDLSGGQALRRSLARSLGLGPEALAFHDFPTIADRAAFKRGLRATIDAAGREAGVPAEAVAAAREAFRLNAALSLAVRAAAAAPRRP